MFLFPKRAVSLSALRDILCRHTGKYVSSRPQLLVLLNWCNARKEEDSLYSEFLAGSVGRDESRTRASAPAVGNQRDLFASASDLIWCLLLSPVPGGELWALETWIASLACWLMFWVWNEIHVFLWCTLKIVLWEGLKLSISVFLLSHTIISRCEHYWMHPAACLAQVPIPNGQSCFS